MASTPATQIFHVLYRNSFIVTLQAMASERTDTFRVFCTALSALAFIGLVYAYGNKNSFPSELLSPLQVGRYAVRAERQSADYDEKAERQIAFATDNDNAATSERDLAAKEESRARDSAYLAADLKATIDKVLEEGRDQVPLYSVLLLFNFDFCFNN